MKLFSSLIVLSLGLLTAVPSPDTMEFAVRDTDPSTSVVPLALYALFQTLEEAVIGVTYHRACQATTDEDEAFATPQTLLKFETDLVPQWHPMDELCQTMGSK
ncbi:hypothetical protein DFH08DRAFT_1074984 [Mycena albidolilacea]|uniref:Uncharacterized protein n=1 Tax=Mycena albidolilacea TaxID=1033008 RepID=A0AAD7AIG0_9AGAR|nr:hypothetical protein DFH08DRAFT_1074984 [Mycena albidolilacea]